VDHSSHAILGVRCARPHGLTFPPIQAGSSSEDQEFCDVAAGVILTVKEVGRQPGNELGRGELAGAPVRAL